MTDQEKYNIAKKIFVDTIKSRKVSQPYEEAFEIFRRKLGYEYHKRFHISFNVPVAPEKCYLCGEDVFDRHMPEYYLSQFVTGCPSCKKSFVS